MTDIELIEKKLAFIDSCVSELRALCRVENIENVVLHGYQRVNPAAVREVVQNHLDDLLNFGALIRAKLHS